MSINSRSSLGTNRSCFEEPQRLLQHIGAGSFATVFSMSGTRTAYKTTRSQEAGEALRHEFNALNTVYMLCNSDSFFKLPRAIAFHDPALNSKDHLEGEGHASPPHDAATSRRNPRLQRDFVSPVYAMERVFVLPSDVAIQIAHEFYPRDFCDEPGPRLCRLYFGKVFEQQPKFFNSANFPLDVARYQHLQQTFGLSPLEDVAYGMGEMLGRIHWRGGYDARDIEFILGGDGYDGCVYYVIDFNQMRKWGRTLDEVHILVEAHYQNDPYYPRARSGDISYQAFRRGYVSVSTNDPQTQTIARVFLQGIEVVQSRRDEGVET